jgi:hypothetical protein
VKRTEHLRGERTMFASSELETVAPACTRNTKEVFGQHRSGIDG